jgi:anti-sigma regulatory factor (Ser/Thr protein kinase)
MEGMNYAIRVPVTDQSLVGEARRVASGLAERLGFSSASAGKVAIVATEAATNLLKHAGGGEILVYATDEAACLEVLALDRGPGISNIAECLRDGYSTAGSSGTGLGAVARLSEAFEVYTLPSRGTVLAIRICSMPRPPAAARPKLEVQGFSIPKPGESACGDAWAVRHSATGSTILAVDGLGHGIMAAEAAHAAVECFMAATALAPGDLLARLHSALRSTRGAAGAVCEIDVGAGQVRFAGVGNISGSIVLGDQLRHVVSMNGTLGHAARAFREFSYDWPAGAILFLHSDGITDHWDPAAYPGLSRKPPGVIAGVIFRDYNRGRDDATVIVAREATPQ